MNARILSISLSVAAAVVMASADALAQGRGGGGGAMGGSMGQGGTHGGGIGGMQSGGMPAGTRGIESVPVERPANAQGRSANSERQAPESAQGQGKTAQDLLTQNPRLADNVSKLLPAGTDVQAAASGFRNLGEFVSAAHVSNNLGIPFSDLKTRLLAGDSLGTAIHALRPGVDAQLEVSRARARADELTRG
jgi:hypothetical protein